MTRISFHVYMSTCVTVWVCGFVVARLWLHLCVSIVKVFNSLWLQLCGVIEQMKTQTPTDDSDHLEVIPNGRELNVSRKPHSCTFSDSESGMQINRVEYLNLQTGAVRLSDYFCVFICVCAWIWVSQLILPQCVWEGRLILATLLKVRVNIFWIASTVQHFKAA